MTREEAFREIWQAAKIYYTQAHGNGVTYFTEEELPPVFAKTKAAFAATLAHGTEPSDSEPQASSTGENGRSQEAADGGKAVMEGEE
jgi:hypothetical protein